jgi:hypothetical protein
MTTTLMVRVLSTRSQMTRVADPVAPGALVALHGIAGPAWVAGGNFLQFSYDAPGERRIEFRERLFSRGGELDGPGQGAS